MPEVRDPCLCGNCPDMHEEHSKCCQYEMKNRAACEKEDVSCIVDVKKMNKVWDKVRKIAAWNLSLIIFFRRFLRFLWMLTIRLLVWESLHPLKISKINIYNLEPNECCLKFLVQFHVKN